MKALALTVWDKKIFKKFLLHDLYVKSENPQHEPISTLGLEFEVFW